MTAIQIPKPTDAFAPPNHLQLPDKDGEFVRNFQEPPQSSLLTDCIRPVLHRLHPDGQYCIGQDSGIYWRHTEPPLKGCKSPDWYYVPDVPSLLDGVVRRSFVLWIEGRAPLVAVEYVSGDGSEERDHTPETGKFWVYEQGIRIPFYVIFEADLDHVEVHHLVDARYQRLKANSRGHFEIPPLGEIGIWKGVYQNTDASWLRWWNLEGSLLPTSEEVAETERQRANAERQRADEECQRANEERQRADEERRRADEEHRRANNERQRAESAEELAQQLAAKLRELGVDPNQV